MCSEGIWRKLVGVAVMATCLSFRVAVLGTLTSSLLLDLMVVTCSCFFYLDLFLPKRDWTWRLRFVAKGLLCSAEQEASDFLCFLPLGQPGLPCSSRCSSAPLLAHIWLSRTSHDWELSGLFSVFTGPVRWGLFLSPPPKVRFYFQLTKMLWSRWSIVYVLVSLLIGTWQVTAAPLRSCSLSSLLVMDLPSRPENEMLRSKPGNNPLSCMERSLKRERW